MSLEKRDIWTETWRAHWDNGGRDWSDAAASQAKSVIATSHQKLERDKEGSFPGAVRGSILDIRVSEL